MTLIEHKKIWDADHPVARYRLCFVCDDCGRDLRTDARAKSLGHAVERVGCVECPQCGFRGRLREPMSERARVRAGDEALAKRLAR